MRNFLTPINSYVHCRNEIGMRDKPMITIYFTSKALKSRQREEIKWTVNIEFKKNIYHAFGNVYNVST